MQFRQIVIHTEKELQDLDFASGSLIIFPVMSSPKHLYTESDLVAVSMFYPKSFTSYIVPVNHSDRIDITHDSVRIFLEKIDSRVALYSFLPTARCPVLFGSIYGDAFVLYERILHGDVENQERTYLSHQTISKIYGSHLSYYSDLKSPIYCIPIHLLSHHFSKFYQSLPALNESFVDGTRDFQKDVQSSFSWIESAGIAVRSHVSVRGCYTKELSDPRLFGVRLLDDGSEVEVLNTSYQFRSTTLRPTCSGYGINFMGLPKDSDIRDTFVSRFGSDGLLISVDYDSYHVRLLAELFGYKDLTTGRVYDRLAQDYFPGKDITPDLIAESKKITFRILYGGVPDEYLHIPFFNLIHRASLKLMSLCSTTPNGDYMFYSHLYNVPIRVSAENVTPAKILNYFVQSLETEKNIRMLVGLQRLLVANDLSSRIIPMLYTYDSVMYDVHRSVSAEDLKLIVDHMSHNNTFPVKVEYGDTYKNMSPLRH